MSIARAIATVVLSAAIGVLSLVVAYGRDPGIALEFDAPLPAFVSGFHPLERDGQTTFAWTTGFADVRLDRLDRSDAWSCSLRFRAFRPEGAPQPTVDVRVDDARVATAPASPEFQELAFALPADDARTTRIGLTIAPTFIPGGGDPRDLGVQVDRLACNPSGLPRPPSRSLEYAAAVGIMAVMLLLARIPALLVLGATTTVSVASAALLTISAAAHGEHAQTVMQVVLLLSFGMALAISIADRTGGARLSTAARVAIVVSGVALLIKVCALLHPSKPIIDAVFHAHRLQAVTEGHYLFTQPVAGAQMPYAIGLYIFAWPWTWLFANHVAVIQVVAASADVAAGLLLYPVVRRAWDNRAAAILAVLAYQLVPLPYAVLGNANLTNMFGQSAALAAIAAAIGWRLDWRRPIALAGFAAIVGWAFSSHIGTITLLSTTLAVLAVMYFWGGGRERRRAAYSIAIAGAIAAVAAWLVYYRHFQDTIIAAFSNMFAGEASAASAAADAVRGYMTPAERLWNLLVQAVGSAGWPLVILAVIGAWAIWRRGTRDRLVSAIIAWTVVWLMFSLSTVVARVDKEYVRYAAEFLGRINLATMPLVAVLAGRGAALGWDEDCPRSARGPLKLAAVALLAWATYGMWNALIGWFYR